MPVAIFFRLFIVISVLFWSLGAFIDGVVPGLVPEELWQAHESVVSQEIRTNDIILIIVGLPLVIAGIVSTIALYRFRPWAPRAALYVSIASMPIYPLIDVQVVSPWSLLLTETSMVLWGVVLAMAFLPPLAERFLALQANNSTKPTAKPLTEYVTLTVRKSN